MQVNVKILGHNFKGKLCMTSGFRCGVNEICEDLITSNPRFDTFFVI
jgi:hypothetical protein